jgi:hypothetical protein
MIEYGNLLKLIGSHAYPEKLPVPATLRDLPPMATIKRLHAQGVLSKAPHHVAVTDEINGWKRAFAHIYPDSVYDYDFGSGAELQMMYQRYEDMGGALIQSTEALEQILVASDLSDDLPAHLFMPPFSALYLHFTPYASQALHPSPEIEVEGDLNGIFCIADMAQEGNRHFTFLSTMVMKDGHTNTLRFGFSLRDDGTQTLNDAIHKSHENASSAIEEWHRRIIGMIAKVFLYMAMKESRQVKETPHKDMLSRLALVGNKKRGKLERQCERLYDRIIIGPEHLPHELQGSGHDHHGVAPHWRRGHFKMQPYGPKAALRKLMFVMPMLVGKDRLGDQEMPVPKAYSVG